MTESKRVEVAGKTLVCPVCSGDKFWHRTALLNTRGATFLGFDWANREADNYVCERCKHMLWFHE